MPSCCTAPTRVRIVAVFELLRDGRPVARNRVFFGKARTLDLPLPHLQVRVHDAPGGIDVTLHGEVLARDVWIGFGALDATLSDNAFDLLPGETRTVHVRSPASPAALRRALRVRDLAGVMSEDTVR